MAIYKNKNESKFVSDPTVLITLNGAHRECESIYKALKLFDNMPQRKVLSWAAIIAGCAQNIFAENSLVF